MTSVEQWVSCHKKCELPGWWERHRRGIVHGAVTTCPVCSIHYKLNGGTWSPDKQIDENKSYILRNPRPFREVWFLREDYPFGGEQRDELREFYERWVFMQEV